jgi:hypothetical protein
MDTDKHGSEGAKQSFRIFVEPQGIVNPSPTAETSFLQL